MRNYGTIAPTFWTGTTGRFLRTKGAESQLLAAYLMTAPSSNMIGLYYLPIPTICHETGLTPKGALKALRSLSEGEFAFYDELASEVWVPEMAHYQVGPSMSAKDNRHKAVVREMMAYSKSKFLMEFHARYGGPYNLPTFDPKEAPSKPLRSQEQEQNQKQDQDQKQNGNGSAAHAPATRGKFVAPTFEQVAAYCKERSNRIDPQKFIDHYTANGWKQGHGKPIVDWQAAIRTWERNNFERTGGPESRVGPGQRHDPEASLKDPDHGKF